MIITATTSSNPQVLGSYSSASGSWYQKIQLVGWISQNTSTLKTTLCMKWRRDQFNYYPYSNDTHNYVVTVGDSVAWAFSIPQLKTNGVFDLTDSVGAMDFTHDSDGTFSGATLNVTGFKCWEGFEENIAVEFPTIAVPEPSPEPTPTPVEPDKPIPLTFDDDPHYYIYADGDLVYSAGAEGFEVLNPKLTLEVNKAGSLEFDIPVGSAMYNRISKLKTVIEARQGNEVLFRGRLLNTKRNTLNTIHYYCEGFLSWLVDITFQPYSYDGQARDFLKYILQRYNSRASNDKKVIYKYSDISARITTEQKNYSTAWNEIKSVLIDNVGGYIVPYLSAEETGIQWLSTYGATTSQVIQFGQNLLDFSEYIDASQVFTAVRAYGKEINGTRIGLSGNNGFVQDNDAIEMFGRIERTVFFDEITTESALRQAATNYLRTGIQAAISINLKAVDFHLLDVDVERMRIGDSVRLVTVPHGIDAYFLCTKTVLDLAHPKNSDYIFGSTQRTISDLTDASYNRYVITEGDSNE